MSFGQIASSSVQGNFRRSIKEAAVAASVKSKLEGIPFTYAWDLEN